MHGYSESLLYEKFQVRTFHPVCARVSGLPCTVHPGHISQRLQILTSSVGDTISWTCECARTVHSTCLVEKGLTRLKRNVLKAKSEVTPGWARATQAFVHARQAHQTQSPTIEALHVRSRVLHFLCSGSLFIVKFLFDYVSCHVCIELKSSKNCCIPRYYAVPN